MSPKKKPSQKIPHEKKRLEKHLGIKIKTLKWYHAALIHPSYRNENKLFNFEDFDRMEFLGDAILNEVICHKIYELFPEANEGLLSRLRSILVSRKIMVKIAAEMKLKGLVLLGNGLKKSSPQLLKGKIMADIFESFIAALYFDRGRAFTEKFILEKYAPYFDQKRLFRLDPNPKSTLQELSLKIWKKLPSYSHSKVKDGIKTTVMIHRLKQASAVHKVRKESELKAARLLIQKIKTSKKKKVSK